MEPRRSLVVDWEFGLELPQAFGSCEKLSRAEFHFVSIRAGFPTTVAPAGTLSVTTAPAPIIAPSPIVTPQRIVALLPMLARDLTIVGTQVQSLSVCSAPLPVVARGYLSLMKTTP